MRSQETRKIAPEMDPLKLGMGWSVADLSKPQIIVESTFGDSHPGSAHLLQFSEKAIKGIDEMGGKGARYFATDICDGMAIAKPFDNEEEAIAAILNKQIQPGMVVIIRYEGPKGSGMPEMFYTTEAISSDPELAKSIALITDGRFSGASKGPAIGHVSPEAADGGPIAFVEENDLIEIDIEKRIINIIGVKGEKFSPEEIDIELKRRKEQWKPKKVKYSSVVLKLFAEHAVSPMKGGYME